MRANISLPLETLKSIIERAREYEFVDDDAFEEEEDDFEEDDESDDADDVIDDDETDAPLLVANDDENDEADEDDDEDSEEDEDSFEDVLEGLTSEELAELLALSWVGEGDHANWDDAVKAARALSQDDIILQLAENPMLSDAIERGLMALGYEIAED